MMYGRQAPGHANVCWGLGHDDRDGDLRHPFKPLIRYVCQLLHLHIYDIGT